MTAKKMLLKTTKWLSTAADLPFGQRSGPRILIYHQVGAAHGLEMNVGLKAFESQLDWLLSDGEIVDLNQAVEMIGMPGDEHRYVLTFDDGHVSLFEAAFPLLKRKGVPFTLFVTTEPMEQGIPLHGDSRMPMVSWGQIREMLDSGLVTIGAHSHAHLDMRAHSENAIAKDLDHCNTILKERLKVAPRHFAYPWGHWSEAADGAVRARYETATVGSGSGIAADFDVHKLTRIPIMASDSNPRLFQRKMWGGFRLETKLRSGRDRLAGPR